MHILHSFVVAVLFVISLSACNQGSPTGVTASDINQSDLCIVDGWNPDYVAKSCKRGQKVAFLPNSFGSEQLPIYFAAFNCDMRYSIVLTNGGVTCIYNLTTIKSTEPQGQPNDKPAK